MYSNQCTRKCSDKHHPAHARIVVGDTDPYLADSSNQYTFNLDCFETEEFLASVSPNDQRLHGVRCFDNFRTLIFLSVFGLTENSITGLLTAVLALWSIFVYGFIFHRSFEIHVGIAVISAFILIMFSFRLSELLLGLI